MIENVCFTYIISGKIEPFLNYSWRFYILTNSCVVDVMFKLGMSVISANTQNNFVMKEKFVLSTIISITFFTLLYLPNYNCIKHFWKYVYKLYIFELRIFTVRCQKYEEIKLLKISVSCISYILFIKLNQILRSHLYFTRMISKIWQSCLI